MNSSNDDTICPECINPECINPDQVDFPNTTIRNPLDSGQSGIHPSRVGIQVEGKGKGNSGN